MITLLLTIAAISLLLAMHPFITYPLSLRLLARWSPYRSQSRPAADRPLSFAVCMCAYNEERAIEAKLRNLLQLRATEPQLGIHVYIDGASDRTAELAAPFTPQIDLYVSAQRHGKTHGMNLLAQRCNADILIFTDTNVLLDARVIEDLRRHFADPEIGCVSGNLCYTNVDDSVTARSGSLYWRFEEALKRMETATGSMMGADGSVFAIRRELRENPPEHIIDDMYVSLLVLTHGYRTVQASDVRAFEQSASHSGEEFRRKVRIACQAFNVHRLIWPRLARLDRLTRYKYVSHKLLRWFCIYFLVTAAIAAGAAAVLSGHARLAMNAAVGALALAVFGHAMGIPPVRQILDLLLSLAGAGLGVWRALRGERFQTWAPAASVRGIGRQHP